MALVSRLQGLSHPRIYVRSTPFLFRSNISSNLKSPLRKPVLSFPKLFDIHYTRVFSTEKAESENSYFTTTNRSSFDPDTSSITKQDNRRTGSEPDFPTEIYNESGELWKLRLLSWMCIIELVLCFIAAPYSIQTERDPEEKNAKTKKFFMFSSLALFFTFLVSSYSNKKILSIQILNPETVRLNYYRFLGNTTSMTYPIDKIKFKHFGSNWWPFAQVVCENQIGFSQRLIIPKTLEVPSFSLFNRTFPSAQGILKVAPSKKIK
eukprot:TRINITY_DN8162_c0_g2_i2.p1 TRINITY_DN8162_c0_g2~~TRINITY_DN8162_c0_g2_i2.p1  ORF type:complete len:264 (-),score=20.96 TRINITY_DN8162_c0_g2_i2:2-793(-)